MKNVDRKIAIVNSIAKRDFNKFKKAVDSIKKPIDRKEELDLVKQTLTFGNIGMVKYILMKFSKSHNIKVKRYLEYLDVENGKDLIEEGIKLGINKKILKELIKYKVKYNEDKMLKEMKKYKITNGNNLEYIEQKINKKIENEKKRFTFKLVASNYLKYLIKTLRINPSLHSIKVMKDQK